MRCVRYSRISVAPPSVYRLLEEVLPLLLSGRGGQGRLAGPHVPDAVAVVTCRKNTHVTRNLICTPCSRRVPLSLKKAIKKHSTDVMQPRYNSLDLCSVSLLIAAAIGRGGGGGNDQRLATAVLSIAMCVPMGCTNTMIYPMTLAMK